MRALIVFCLALSISSQTFAASNELPDDIWEGVKRFITNRKDAILVWSFSDLAEVDGPAVTISARLWSVPVYECVGTRVGWFCQPKRDDLHIDANGKRHRFQAANVDHADVVRIADFVYSPCFDEQWRALGSPNPWRTYGNPITGMSKLPSGDFAVSGRGRSSSISFVIREALPSDNGCGFQLIRVGGLII